MTTNTEINDVEMRDVRPLSEKAKGKAVLKVNESKSHLPWVEKYRPTSLNDLVSHKDITQTIQKFIETGKIPHLLFYGPPGTGKTSTILACARNIYGPGYKNMILELNASDDRGIEVVREKIKTFASTKKIFSSGFKLIVLDECDAMTQVAQAALRRVIEKYTHNVRFCLICNYVSKIIPALQSRCTRFRFSPLERHQIQDRLNYIISSEGINLTESGLQGLLRLSKGDMRRALNILQACHAAYDEITEDCVYNCTGSPLPEDIQRMLTWIMNDEFTTAYKSIMKLKTEKGLALQDIVTDLYEFIDAMELPSNCRIYILDKLADIEFKLSLGCSEKIQVGSLLGSFKLMVEMMN